MARSGPISKESELILRRVLTNFAALGGKKPSQIEAFHFLFEHHTAQMYYKTNAICMLMTLDSRPYISFNESSFCSLSKSDQMQHGLQKTSFLHKFIKCNLLKNFIFLPNYCILLFIIVFVKYSDFYALLTYGNWG